MGWWSELAPQTQMNASAFQWRKGNRQENQFTKWHVFPVSLVTCERTFHPRGTGERETNQVKWPSFTGWGTIDYRPVKITRWGVDRLLDSDLSDLILILILFHLSWFDLVWFSCDVIRFGWVNWFIDWLSIELTWLFDLIVRWSNDCLIRLADWLTFWLIHWLFVHWHWTLIRLGKVWLRTFKTHARGKFHSDLWIRINLQVVSVTSFCDEGSCWSVRYCPLPKKQQ